VRVRARVGGVGHIPRTHQHHALQVEILYNEYDFVAAFA